ERTDTRAICPIGATIDFRYADSGRWRTPKNGQLSKHASHRFYSIHQIIQLGKLAFGERSPAFRSASDITETKEQISDFSQCKTELTLCSARSPYAHNKVQLSRVRLT